MLFKGQTLGSRYIAVTRNAVTLCLAIITEKVPGSTRRKTQLGPTYLIYMHTQFSLE